MKLAFPLSTGQNLKTYARSFEEECSVCHQRLKRWRLNKNIVRFDKKGFLNMYRVSFWKKSSENLLKWHHIYWSTLWNPIKNGHSREWMWHCYLDCPRLENRVFKTCLHEFRNTMAGVTGKNAFLTLTRARLQKPMATVALRAFSVGN